MPRLMDPSRIGVDVPGNILASSFRPATVLRAKVAVVGDAGTGKSSLIRGGSGTSCPEGGEYAATTDVELTVRQVPVPDTDVVVDLFVYDVPGQQIFEQERRIQSAAYAGAACVVCCYDVSSRASFANCPDWIASARSVAGNEDARVLVVANKADLQRGCDAENDGGDGARPPAEVDPGEGRKYAEDGGHAFFECNAFDAATSEALFRHVAEQIHQQDRG